MYGIRQGYETGRFGFKMSGGKYFQRFKEVAERRVAEGFSMFKFDGLGAGTQGAEENPEDFEAMLHLASSLRRLQSGAKQVWISLTIGTWPSPFWMLWADTIWRDGPDVGAEGQGSPRERWLTFRDRALRRALARGPLTPMAALMQHGLVWSRSAETNLLWPSDRQDRLEDFYCEAVTFFLAGTVLQELYIQPELLDKRMWALLAEVSALARREAEMLRDAHPIEWHPGSLGGNPERDEVYGVASLLLPESGSGLGFETHLARAVMWWRNPAGEQQAGRFSLGLALELPEVLWTSSAGATGVSCWEVRPLQLHFAPDRFLAEKAPRFTAKGAGCSCAESSEELQIFAPADVLQVTLEAFDVWAWEVAVHKGCTALR